MNIMKIISVVFIICILYVLGSYLGFKIRRFLVKKSNNKILGAWHLTINRKLLKTMLLLGMNINPESVKNGYKADMNLLLIYDGANIYGSLSNLSETRNDNIELHLLVSDKLYKDIVLNNIRSPLKTTLSKNFDDISSKCECNYDFYVYDNCIDYNITSLIQSINETKSKRIFITFGNQTYQFNIGRLDKEINKLLKEVV